MPSYNFTLCVAFALCTCFTPQCNECNKETLCGAIVNSRYALAVTSRLWFVQPYLRESLILCSDLERVFLVYIEEEKNVGHDKTRDFAIITRQKRINDSP